MALSNLVKGILSTVGGFLIFGLLGTTYTWSATNVYYASYLYNSGQTNVEIKDVFFFMPTMWMVQYLTLTPGLQLTNYITVRGGVALSVVMITITFTLLYFIANFALAMVGMVLFGLGIGACYLAVIRNLWKYFPTRTGLFNGIILGAVGFSSAILSPVADFMINPDKIKPGDKGIYPPKVSDNVPKFFLLMLCLIAVFGTISIICTFPFVPEESDDNAQLTAAEQPKSHLKEAFFSIKNLQLIILSFTAPFFLLFMPNIARSVGNLNGLDQMPLQIMSWTFSGVNGAMRFVWGYLYDKFKFKPLMFIILTLEIAVGCSIYFIASNIYCYFAWNMVMAIGLGGVFVIITPTFNKVFGPKDGADVFGISSIVMGFASVAGPCLTQFIITGKEKEEYMIVFFCCAGVALIGFISLFWFTDEKFVYAEDTVTDEPIAVALSESYDN